jgi:hypothetical protein
MPVVVENREYELLPSPSWGGYVRKRTAPKIRFQSAKGYVHQRESFPSPRGVFSLEWGLLSDAEKNLLSCWLDYIGSASFCFVVPESIWPRPDGSVIPEVRLCRVTDEEIDFKPLSYGWWSAKITVEEI